MRVDANGHMHHAEGSNSSVDSDNGFDSPAGVSYHQNYIQSKNLLTPIRTGIQRCFDAASGFLDQLQIKVWRVKAPFDLPKSVMNPLSIPGPALDSNAVGIRIEVIIISRNF